MINLCINVISVLFYSAAYLVEINVTIEGKFGGLVESYGWRQKI